MSNMVALFKRRLREHKVLAGLLSFTWVVLTGALAEAAIGVVGGHRSVLLGVGLFVLLLSVFVLAIGPLNEVYYYRVFIFVFSRLVKRLPSPFQRAVRGVVGEVQWQMAELILESREFDRDHPVLVEGQTEVNKRTQRASFLVKRVEHLLDVDPQVGAAFSLVLLFNEPRIRKTNGRIELHVDLEGQQCAVWNNRGKSFLWHKFLPDDPARTSNNWDHSHELHRFMLGLDNRKELAVRIHPLRWSSGGFLPIVDWKGREWVCLFFRDIRPIGWNGAMGGSERRAEHIHPGQVIYRETMEELVICDGSPAEGAHVTHRRFRLKGFPWKLPDSLDRMCEWHDRLRGEHDGIVFRKDSDGPLLQNIVQNAPFRVVVHPGPVDELRTAQNTDDVLLVINPFELGVELVGVGRFTLEEHETILDGEVRNEHQESYLTRMPIGLIALDFLRGRFERDGRLGEPIRNPDCMDGGDLGFVPRDSYHLFLDDIELRRNRLRRLKASSVRGSRREVERIERWLDLFGAQFEEAHKQGTRGLSQPLTSLLPTTWKALELAFVYKVI